MTPLSEKEWREFPIDELFTVGAGKRLTNADKTDGNRPFVGATDNTNGVTGFVGNSNASLDRNVLGVNYNGAPCNAFYHPYECVFTDDVKRLHLRDYEDGEDILLFLATLIKQQRPKYGYGYKCNEKRMVRQKIMLPVDENGLPDYEYMEQYAAERRQTLLNRYREYAAERIARLELKDIPALDEKEWATFHIGDLFTVTRPRPRNKDDYEEGDIPFIASGALNNGAMKCCTPREWDDLDKGNCITVSPVDGSSFYQPVDFLGRGGAGSSILILRAEGLNPYRGLFLARAIQQTCSKYTYGRMGNTDSVKRDRILLPVTDDGQPDYGYMEQYVKNIMLDKYRQYLVFIDQRE